MLQLYDAIKLFFFYFTTQALLLENSIECEPVLLHLETVFLVSIELPSQFS